MSSSTYRHLQYLQQLSDMIEDDHKNLAANYGHIMKSIMEKNLVHVNGKDSPKLRRCKACHGPINAENLGFKNKKVQLTCPLCATTRTYPQISSKSGLTSGPMLMLSSCVASSSSSSR